MPRAARGVSTGCAPTIAPYSATAYEQATSLKVESLALMDRATDPFARHAEDVTALWRWIVVALAVSAAGWMVFDGLRALIVGDYITPTSGPHAGQLGPWASVVSSLGIDPRATPVKGFFVLYGTGWLVVIAAFVRGRTWAWRGMVVAAAGSLWYLVIGTISSSAQLALLLLLRARAPSPRAAAPMAGSRAE